MKKRILAFIFLLGFFGFGQELLVFNDGRTLKIPGPYQIKGTFLQYHDEDGTFLQLPLKIIDLEKSKKATQEYRAALEAEKNKPEPVKEEPKEKSLTEVAEFVERGRPEGEMAPTDLSITDDGVDEYRSRNPLSDNQQVERTGISPELSASEITREQQVFKESYDNIQKEIDEIDQQIEATEKMIIAMQNQLIYGDDPTTNTYDSMERGEKRLEELKAEREKKVDEQKRLANDARRMGFKGINRPAKQRTLPKKKAGDELKEYEEEGSMEYVEEDHPG